MWASKKTRHTDCWGDSMTEDYLSLSDVLAHLGYARTRVRNWMIHTAGTDGQFPEPDVTISRSNPGAAFNDVDARYKGYASSRLPEIKAWLEAQEARINPRMMRDPRVRSEHHYRSEDQW